MRSLLLTGGAGFVGRNILPLLAQHYEVTTLGRGDRHAVTCNLACDIPAFDRRFDVVVHAAGKAHAVPVNETEAQAFYDVNVNGTVNLCRGLEKTGVPQRFIFISSCAVYGCTQGEHIDETWPLNGTSPYALSKIRAEAYLQEWCSRHQVVLSVLRPSLIAGPCPPGNLHSMIEGLKKGLYLRIAGGWARKSVLMVQDIARLILLLDKTDEAGVYNICDDEHPSFRELEGLICGQLGKGAPLNIPYWLAKCLALVGDCMGKHAPVNSRKLEKITCSLTFCNDRAKGALGWTPISVMENFRIYE